MSGVRGIICAKEEGYVYMEISEGRRTIVLSVMDRLCREVRSIERGNSLKQLLDKSNSRNSSVDNSVGFQW